MEFNDIEAAAYMGNHVDYDNLDPVEYKYFARIRQLGIDSRSGKIASQTEIVSKRNQYHAQYQAEREIQDKLEAYNAAWVACLKVTESLRTHISKETDPLKIAALALRAVYTITNDCMMEVKMKQMEELVK